MRRHTSFGKLASGYFGRGHLQGELKWDPKAFQILNAVRGDLLTDSPELLVVHERFSVCLIEFMALNGMRAAGRFDDRPLLGAIRHHSYPAIALNEDLLEWRWRNHAMMWSQLKQAITENYHLVPIEGPALRHVAQLLRCSGHDQNESISPLELESLG